MASTHFVVFGPPGRRITNLAASPNGRFLACLHVPQNYNTADYHHLFFRQAGDTYVEAGPLPEPPPARHDLRSSIRRSDFAPLDDGGCLVLETDHSAVYLARYEPSAGGMAEAARWEVAGTLSLCDASLRLLPSGREALVLVTDQDDKQVDWGGGPPPDYIQTWIQVDVATGVTRERTSSVSLAEPSLSLDTFRGSRGVSVLVALGAPPWVGTRSARECEALQKIILPLAWKALESAIRAGSRRLLTSKRVIDIASGETLLGIQDDPRADRFGTPPRFHDGSPDENHVLSTGEGGHFELWNVTARRAWRPSLPAHGGVHTASFLPDGRAALGTAQGGVIVVDCAKERIVPSSTSA
jgi:hypothetical protein